VNRETVWPARRAGHTLAHVYFETDDHDAGAGFLSGWLASYERTATYFCHLAWHLALFALAAGDALVEGVVLPIVHGIAAFGGGDYAETIRRLEPVGAQLVRVGGSNLQRDVFEETLLVAYVRAGRAAHVERDARKEEASHAR
jgi:hypothetical protein